MLNLKIITDDVSIQITSNNSQDIRPLETLQDEEIVFDYDKFNSQSDLSINFPKVPTNAMQTSNKDENIVKNDKSYSNYDHWSSDDDITDYTSSDDPSDNYPDLTDSSDDSSSDDGSESDLYEKFFSKKKDSRIMFAESNLTVSDVILMLQAIIIKFNKTREEQNALLKLIKELAGPSFDTWNYSPYMLAKYVAPPKETMKKHYYCPTCNCILSEIFLSDKKKISIVCDICKNKFLISPQNPNYFISLNVRYQLEKLLCRKDIQQSIFNWSKETSISKENVITDITDSSLYKQNIKGSDVLSFNFSTDGAQLFKSAKKALWPLQLHLNYFSDTSRFKYPVIVALHGKKFLGVTTPTPVVTVGNLVQRVQVTLE